MQRHDEPVPLSRNHVLDELALELACVHRHEGLDDAAVRGGDDEVLEAVLAPRYRRESRHEELAPSLFGLTRRQHAMTKRTGELRTLVRRE